jgi:transcriptional regulator with XRE-family HTH domain
VDDVTVAAWTGAKALALRTALRLTQEQFAEFLDVATRSVAKWELSPKLVPRLSSQELLDTALSRAPAEAKSRFAQLMASDDNEGPDSAKHGPVESARSYVGQKSVDLTLMNSLEEALQSHYEVDNSLGPRALLPMVEAQLGSIAHVRSNASSRDLDRILRIEAGYAEFSAWLYQDLNDPRMAAERYRMAFELANVCGDERMTSFVLMRRAAQSAANGDGSIAVRYAQASQRNGSAPQSHRARMLAAQAEAVGHAVTGSELAMERALEAAEQMIEAQPELPRDGDPAEIRYCEPRLYHQITRAQCQLTLGLAREAVTSFSQILIDLPDAYHRDRGQYQSRLARAHLLAGEPEMACHIASQALDIARQTDSLRTTKNIAAIAVDLRKDYAALPTVRDLTEQLRDR